MKSRLLPLALLGIAPFMLVACGNEDDVSDGVPEGATEVATQAQEDATETATTDGDTETATPATGDATTQEEYDEYVGSVCEAGREFRQQLEEAASQLQNQNLGEAQDTAVQAFQDFGDRFGELDAPSELEAWQEDMEDRLDTIATGLESGDVNQLTQAFTTEFPAVPAGVQDNVEQAVQENDACPDAAIFNFAG